jgi:hypothetical protein
MLKVTTAFVDGVAVFWLETIQTCKGYVLRSVTRIQSESCLSGPLHISGSCRVRLDSDRIRVTLNATYKAGDRLARLIKPSNPSEKIHYLHPFS